MSHLRAIPFQILRGGGRNGICGGGLQRKIKICGGGGGREKICEVKNMEVKWNSSYIFLRLRAIPFEIPAGDIKYAWGCLAKIMQGGLSEEKNMRQRSEIKICRGWGVGEKILKFPCGIIILLPLMPLWQWRQEYRIIIRCCWHDGT